MGDDTSDGDINETYRKMSIADKLAIKRKPENVLREHLVYYAQFMSKSQINEYEIAIKKLEEI
jgi:hypothetical protein